MTEREYLELLLKAAKEYRAAISRDDWGHRSVRRWHDLKTALAASTAIMLIETYLETGNTDGGEVYSNGV